MPNAEFEVGADARPFVDAMAQMDRAWEKTQRKITTTQNSGLRQYESAMSAHSRKIAAHYEDIARKAEQSARRRAEAEKRAGGGGVGRVMGSLGMLALGGAAVSQVRTGIRDEMDYRRTAAALDRPLDQMGVGRAAADGRIEGLERRTGVDDTEIAGMLSQTLNAGERDLNNAFAKIGLAMDIQAAGFADANSVLSAFNKGGAENAMMLRKLAQSMGITIKETDSVNEVVAKMNQAVGGTAEKAHKATGAMGELSVAFDNARQKIGADVADFWGPIASKIMGMLDGSSNVPGPADIGNISETIRDFKQRMADITTKGDALAAKNGGALTPADSEFLKKSRDIAKTERDKRLAAFGLAMTSGGLRQLPGDDANPAASNAAPTVSDKLVKQAKTNTRAVPAAPLAQSVNFNIGITTPSGVRPKIGRGVR